MDFAMSYGASEGQWNAPGRDGTPNQCRGRMHPARTVPLSQSKEECGELHSDF